MPTIKVRRKRAASPPPAAAPTPAPPPDKPRFVPGLPVEGGPPKVRNYDGASILLDKSGAINVTLDRGALQWLWELAESKTYEQWCKYNDVESMKPVSDAGIRACEAIRLGALEAKVFGIPGITDGSQDTKKKPRIKRKSSATPSTPKKKITVKRK
jgi:hypothetical protein